MPASAHKRLTGTTGNGPRRTHALASRAAHAQSVNAIQPQRFEVAQARNAPVASAPIAMRPKSGTSNGARAIRPP